MTIFDRLPYILLMIVSAFVSAVVAFRAYKSRRKVTRADSFAMMAICASVWMVLVALDTLSTSLAWKEILWGLIPFAILNTLIGLFFFSLEFSLRLKRVPKNILFPTVILALVISALSATNHLHHQVWTVSEVNGQFTQVFGNLYLIQIVYAYLLTFSSLTLLIRAYLFSTGVLRRQTGLLLVGILIPVLVSFTDEVFAWNPLPYVDETAFSILFTVVLFGWATLRFNAFYLLPVASDMIIKNLQNGVLVTDVEGLIIFSNPAAQKIFEKKENQINGHPVGAVLAEWLPEAFQAWKGGKEDVQLIFGEEQFRFYRLTTAQLAGSAGESVGYLLTLYNNTDQKNYEKRLNELAISDPLTGSYNRRFFYEMVHAYFNQMLRSSKPLSILMIDLDQFKQINDTHGHIKGDLVLQKVAAVCKSLVRTQDIFSRFGGEEFILAMPETSLRNALLVAERLRRAIEALKNEFEGIPITASIGVVETVGETNLTLDVLLHRADQAMYLSKQAGRNRVTAWENA
jgi:diguanylate cyclase (GGDEF)-like protein